MNISLYDLTATKAAIHYRLLQKEIIALPHLLPDVLYKLFMVNDTKQLFQALNNLDTFLKCLFSSKYRLCLHGEVQALMNEYFKNSEEFDSICTNIANKYNQKVDNILSSEVEGAENVFQQGIHLADFFGEAGWFEVAENILLAAQKLLLNENTKWEIETVCLLYRLLKYQSAFCKFEKAEESKRLVLLLISNNTNNSRLQPHLACVYSIISALHLLRVEYAEAYEFSIKALKEVSKDVPLTQVIEVLRHASKAFVLKRDFQRAEILIMKAVHLAKELYGTTNLQYADTLIDFGFYYLQADVADNAVILYSEALSIKSKFFSRTNLVTALIHENLAYAIYVLFYTHGRFDLALENAEECLHMMYQLLPANHMLTSSCKRVKALILEEMAIDNPQQAQELQYLQEAYTLHCDAIQSTLKTFGLSNVQTAKHFGNMGRLMQTRKMYKDAELMHLSAIEIKEELLGPDDSEVSLSLGHLASLYNYDMALYDKAEKLYLRSIKIGKELLGEAYSGLEYDYRGLIEVYRKLNDPENEVKYLSILQDWTNLQETTTTECPFAKVSSLILNVDDVIGKCLHVKL